MAKKPKSNAIAVVTVHGTGDTATELGGEKWFQQGSAFSKKLQEHLLRAGVESEIVPHLWSGANSAWERERGANKLAKSIRKLNKQYAGVHVIGHSHGGNVANDAAVLLRWGLRKRKNEKLDSVTTVGTPFFNSRTPKLQLLAGLMFLVIAWGSAIAVPITAIGSLVYILVMSTQPGNEGAGVAAFVAWLLYVGIVGPCAWFMLGMSRQGIRRILRPRPKKRALQTIFSLFHKNDEAIAFLQRVEELPLEPFARGALFRGSRAAGVGWGVVGVIVLCIAIPFMHAANWIPASAFTTNIFNAVLWSVIGILSAPALFTVVYFFYRFVVGGIQEYGFRGPVNRFVVGVLRGVAYGRDGDQVLCNISTNSHTHHCQQYVIDGDCAARMQAGAHEAAGKLIEKYRWSLFQVGGDSTASLTTLTTDAMTWDSLIHTTYFDQPEVAEVIAGYIAAKAKGSEFAAPGAAPTAPTSPPVTPPPETPMPPETPEPPVDTTSADDISRAA